MYTLYSDKPNLFECSIQLEGTSIANSFARLIIESEKNSLVFNGKINENGICLVPIKKIKGLVSESGNMRLEVVAEDMYFNPWNSEYELTQSKSVTVEVKQPTKPLIENKTPKVEVKYPEKNIIKEEKPKRTTKKKVTLTKRHLEDILRNYKR
jgi:hypothetical protein|tara:strand:- start:17558 stop:18016 length:459 start_codon:yes stop_codon:yes gene_type:complete